MSLKDFSFAQLNRSAQLKVGVEKKSDKDDLPVAKNLYPFPSKCPLDL